MRRALPAVPGVRATVKLDKRTLIELDPALGFVSILPSNSLHHQDRTAHPTESRASSLK